MGRFGHMLKSAATKGQNVLNRGKGEEPETFPDMKVGVWRQNDAQMDDLENGFDAKAVKFFFANWNASDEEKMRLRDWMAPIINNEILSFEVLQGYTIKRASPFVGEVEACEL